MLQRRVLALALAWLALFLQTALAVFADDAYSVDYHLALLGLPQQQASFFHQPYQASKASLLYTLSERNLLGAINPRDGTLVWRQLLQSTSNATRSFLRAGEDADTVVTATDGQVAAWSAADGRVVWTHSLEDVLVHGLEVLELDTGKGRSEDGKDIVLLVGNSNPSVRSLDGTSGRIKWEYKDTRYARDVPSLRVWLTSVKVATHHYRCLHPLRPSTTSPHTLHLQGG